MERISIHSVNISVQKGTPKTPASVIVLNKLGIEEDAHSGAWHRQVSLLGIESIAKAETLLGRKLQFGEFAENITTEGYPLYKMKPLDRLASDELVLEVTQIGKKCHGAGCSIYKETGDCVMPKEGIFCRVLSPGKLKAGDYLEYHPRVVRIKIITVSDRASRGEYEDKSGPLLSQLAGEFFNAEGRLAEASVAVVPDEEPVIRSLVKDCIATGYDIIFTTGGTGISHRDVTPEAVKPLITKEIPGIMELIRVKYGMQMPNALVSRGIAGLSEKSLIYTLPGSPKAVKEYASEILKTIEHSLRMIYGIDIH